jgi:molybdenum cofactor biosynthesis enzyme MoaA
MIGPAELTALIRDIKESSSGKAYVKLVSNGTLLKGLTPALVSAGLDGATVSIHSLNRATYQRITGQDLLRQALASIDELLMSPLDVTLNVALTDTLVGELHDYIAFLRERPMLRMKLFDVLGSTTSDTKDSSIRAAMETLAEASQSYQRLSFPYRHVRYSVRRAGAIILKLSTFGNDCPNAACAHRDACLEGCRHSVRLSQDGYLYPCGVRSDNRLCMATASDNAILQALASGGKEDLQW